MKTKLAKNLKNKRRALSLTQTELANELDVSRPALASYEERRAIPKIEDLMRIATFFNVSIETLVFGDCGDDVYTQSFPRRKKRASSASKKKPSIKNVHIPYVKHNNTFIADTSAAAGSAFMDEQIRGTLDGLPSTYIPNAPSGVNIAFQIEGDSMHPTIKHLDYVAGNKINNIDKVKDGHIYIIIDIDEGILCKRLYRIGNEEFDIVSDNTKYPPYRRHCSKILRMFKVFSRISSDFHPDKSITDHVVEELNQRISMLEQKLLK